MGEVRDASNAAIAHAKVMFRSNDSGVETSVESDGEGVYATPAVIPGSYTLSASKAGFKTEQFGPVTVRVNQAVRVNFTLPLGAVSDSIQVSATPAQLLSPESADVSQVIGNQQVAELPLNGRVWQQLVALSAGTNPGAPGESGSPNPVNINGQRDKANLFLVDGVSTTSSIEGRGNDFNLPIDAIQEFSVQAGAYSAEYGDVAGGVINLQSKSGTNNWHGSLFEYLRNDDLDAADFFSNATAQPKNALRYNQFGGSGGGPLRRNRTFIFGDYQGTVTHSGQPMITTVPLVAQRGGDFSGLRTAAGAPVPIYDPSSTTPAFTRTPFQNNVIPSTRLDQAASALSALLPAPNQFDGSGNPLAFNNYAVTRAELSDFQAFDLRIDHHFSQRHSLFARESWQHTGSVVPSLFGLPLGGPPVGAGNTSSGDQGAAVGETFLIGQNSINEARIGLNRQTTALTQQDFGQNLSSQFGIPGFNQSPATSGLSNIVVSGLFSLGGSILTPLHLETTQLTGADKYTRVIGRQVLRFGVDYQHELGSAGYLLYGRGNYTFLGLSTSTLVGPAGGNAYASFLVGAPFLILRDEFPPGQVGLISYRVGFYAQDDIKLTPKLTMNLGARYDIMPYPREMHDRLSNFDPATRTMLIAGQNTSDRLVNTDFRDLAPRLGIAYAPGGGKTVLRAGYGIGFIDPIGAAGILNSNEFNIPFYYLNNITEFPFSKPTYNLSSALPGLVMPSPLSPSGNQRYIVPTDGNQYSQTWSVTIQHAVNKTSMFEVSYVGTSGNRLLTADNINAALPGATNPVNRQPFGPALGEIRELSNTASSIYHGLQSKFEKRFSNGLYFLGSYTWSKSIDDQSNGTDTAGASGQYPQNPLNPGLDRGLSSFDRTHRLVGSAVWEVPSLREGPPWLRPASRGWQLSGIFLAESGPPFSVLMNCADINAQGNNCRPNLIAPNAVSAGPRSIAEWFNTAAFQIPSTPAYGNAGRNILRGPGTVNLDVGISKAFSFADTRRVVVRGDFFNALNHTNLSLPVNLIDSPSFGSIISASPAREIQLGARMEF